MSLAHRVSVCFVVNMRRFTVAAALLLLLLLLSTTIVIFFLARVHLHTRPGASEASQAVRRKSRLQINLRGRWRLALPACET